MHQYDGLFGLAFLLLAFLLQISVMLKDTRRALNKKEKTAYLLNVLGAGLLSLYAFRIENLYFAVLEIAWLLGAFVVVGTVIKNHLYGRNP